jgi:hypothetical protein
VVALRGQQHEGGQQTGQWKGNGVLGEHTQTDAYADADPVAWVASAEDAGCEEDGNGPGEEVEGGVLQYGAEGERKGKDDEQRKKLRCALSAEFAGGQADEDECRRVHESRGQA